MNIFLGGRKMGCGGDRYRGVDWDSFFVFILLAWRKDWVFLLPFLCNYFSSLA